MVFSGRLVKDGGECEDKLGAAVCAYLSPSYLGGKTITGAQDLGASLGNVARAHLKNQSNKAQ
jgi:hypothetical protein